MTITQLRYFIVAAQTENLLKAAAALYISQSSLSKNIAALEKELGVDLFDRNGKSLRLNEAGGQFLASCQKMLGEFDNVLEGLKRSEQKNTARVRTGVEGEIGPLLSWMADFQALHPETAYEIDSSLSRQTHPDINEYDVMVYPEGRRYSKFRGYPYFVEQFLLAVPAEDMLARQKTVSIRELGERDYVFIRRGEEGIEHPHKICRALMVELRSEHFVDRESLKRSMIAEGIALGFVSGENAPLYLADGRIRLLPLISSSFSRQMMICFKRKKHLTPLAEAFCAYVSGRASIRPAEA